MAAYISLNSCFHIAKWNSWIICFLSLNFLWNVRTVFHCDCTSLHSCQQCRRVLFLPHRWQHLFFLAFLIIAILVRFGFAFAKWLVTLCILSCACRPPVCLWEGVYSVPLPILWLNCCSCYCCWVTNLVALVEFTNLFICNFCCYNIQCNFILGVFILWHLTCTFLYLPCLCLAFWTYSICL